MTNGLAGWTEIEDLPSAKDLNDLYRRHHDKVPRRDGLIAIADKVEGYIHPGNPVVDGRVLCGLRFQAAEGSVLLTFPFPPDVGTMPVGIYIMGGATPAHASDIVRDFHKALEQRVLPAEAHVGDDPS